MGDTKVALWAMCVFVSVIVVEIVQSVRAERAMYACEAHGLRHRRISFTAEVVCVPVVKEVGRE